MPMNREEKLTASLNYEHISGNDLKAIFDFLFGYCDTVSLTQSHNIGMTKNEADFAKKEHGEFLKECGMNDGIAPTEEEMLESFHNIAETEEECNEMIQRYKNSNALYESKFKQNDEEIMQYLKENFASYKLKSRNVTCMTPCTHGGPMVMYFFEPDNTLKNNLYSMDDLFQPVIYDPQRELLLDDPTFYHKGRILLSVCSHERLATMFFNTEQYEEFKKLNIPHKLQ